VQRRNPAPRYIEPDADLIRRICLTVEAAIEADDDYSTKLEQINFAGYRRDEVSDQIMLLRDSGFVEAEQLGSDMRYSVQRLTAKGWQFVNAVREK
jgi:DNA-binding transcriptional ArsR family regulator